MKTLFRFIVILAGLAPVAPLTAEEPANDIQFVWDLSDMYADLKSWDAAR